MGSHTEKITCEECGAAVKVPAGQEFEDVHKHDKSKDAPAGIKRGDDVTTAGATSANATQRTKPAVTEPPNDPPSVSSGETPPSTGDKAKDK